MRKTLLALSLVVLLLSAMAQVYSQEAEPEETPLLVSGRVGDNFFQKVLYRYVDNGWEQLPVDGFYAGSLSPDGTQLAYLHIPMFLDELVVSGQDYLYGTAWDIAILNLADGSTRDIVAQPETIMIDASGYSGGIKRSTPVWSPDGTALAWIEQDYPAQGVARLVVYDLESDETRVVDDAVPQMGLSADGLPDRFNWGSTGIAVFTNDPSDFAPILRLYDATGSLQVLRLPDTEWFPTMGPLWVTGPEGETVVIEADGADWYEVDPAAGAVGRLGMMLEGVSANNPDGSPRVLWDVFALEGTSAWQLVAADGTELLAWPEPLGSGTIFNRFAFDPSGQAAAYMVDGVLYVWRDGTTTEIAPPEGVTIQSLYWGPMRWQAGATYEAAG